MTLGRILCVSNHLSNAINTSRTMQTSINTSWIQTQLLINTSNKHIGREYKTKCHRYANKILWWCMMMGETATTCFLQGSLSKAIEFTNSLSTLEREWVCTHRCEEKSYSSRHIEMRLSSPQRYPSSWFPSSQGVRWSTWTPGGTSTVLPKSIICTLVWPELSYTNNRELPTTCAGREGRKAYHDVWTWRDFLHKLVISYFDRTLK